MAEWVEFKGTAKETSDGYHLTTSDNNGVLEAKKDAVSVQDGKVRLKVGETVKIGVDAKGKRPDSQPRSPGCSRTACIGLVLICCDNGQVIGACIGAFGC
jgi:hypothetical protein